MEQKEVVTLESLTTEKSMQILKVLIGSIQMRHTEYIVFDGAINMLFEKAEAHDKARLDAYAERIKPNINNLPPGTITENKVMTAFNNSK